MDQTIFEICSFQKSPVEEGSYIDILTECLKSGIPPTITTADVELASTQLEGQLIAAGDVGTTPLHQICGSVNGQDENQVEIASKMIEVLFQYGANWSMMDKNNETPGCIARRRRLASLYEQFVQAGVRSEVFLRRMTEGTNDDDGEVDGTQKGEGEDENEEKGDTAVDQQAYLASRLEYSEGTLITREARDGVMMEWERPIMKKSAELITQVEPNDSNGLVVLNVGFGMGIIDSFIQEAKPFKHYISEAHPDVLKKLREDGWYDKEDVIILEGRWQDTLPQLIDEGVILDGIYYDTFSEHYQDLVNFFDLVYGLLSPEGVFSFFNGLGADLQISYDVYSHVVEVDLKKYGFKVEYIRIEIGPGDAQQWEGIRQKYWNLHEFLLPKITFDF